MMDRCQRFDLRRSQNLAPLACLALAEEPFGIGRPLDEAVPLPLLAQHLEGAELDRLVDAVARRLQPEEGGNAGKSLVGCRQQILVANHMQPRARLVSPAHDMLRPGAIALIAMDLLIG